MNSQRMLRKVLTDNDVGRTGSHQAGFHVSKDVADFFPGLSRSAKNPDIWLPVLASGEPERWRYIYYNNKLTGSGTRDEYRLTHVRSWMDRVGAAPGDVVEL